MTHTVPVEDPIHSLFDLADHATWEAPKIREAYRHSLVIVGIVLFFVLVGDLATLYFSIVLNHLIFIGFAVLTLIFAYVVFVFRSIQRADSLIGNFFDKLRAIDAVERLEAESKIPEGGGPVERYARFIWSGSSTLNPSFRGAQAASMGPRAWVVGGRTVRFDLVSEQRGSLLYRLTGWGNPGLLLLLRYLPTGITMANVDGFADDVRAVASVGSSLPSRLVLLRSTSDPIPDDVYARITRQPIPLRYRFTRKNVPLQVISERRDGNYDFTPHLVDLP